MDNGVRVVGREEGRVTRSDGLERPSQNPSWMREMAYVSRCLLIARNRTLC